LTLLHQVESATYEVVVGASVVVVVLVGASVVVVVVVGAAVVVVLSVERVNIGRKVNHRKRKRT
jgi:hypothetical protein